MTKRARVNLIVVMLGLLLSGTAGASVFDRTPGRVLGQGGFAMNGSNFPTAGDTGAVFDVATDTTTGRVYVSDLGNNRVLWWDSAVAWTSGMPATGWLGQPDPLTTTENTGGISASSLKFPTGLAVDGEGNVWVADTGNNRVLKFARPTGPLGNTAVLVLGQNSFSSNAGGCSDSALREPHDVCVDAAGNVWVTDFANSRVVRFPRPSLPFGSVADQFLGQSNLSSGLPNRGNASCSANSLSMPWGLTIDGAGNLWVADLNNSRVLRFPPDAPVTDGAADMVLGQPTFGTKFNACGDTSLRFPCGVGTDPVGDVWVADTGNNRVVVFYTPTQQFGEVADGVLGQPDLTTGTVNFSGINAMGMCAPRGVAADAAGGIWVADTENCRALRFTPPFVAGGTPAIVVQGQRDFTHNIANGVDATGLSRPQSVVVDPSSARVYVSDSNNNRVLWWNDRAALNNGLPADGVLGQPDFFSIREGTALDRLRNPGALAVDKQGNVWVADLGNYRVLKFNKPTQQFGEEADLVLGQANATGSGSGTGRGGFGDLAGIAVDDEGNVWVADGGASRVLKFNAPTQQFGEEADLVLGQPDFDTATDGCGTAALSCPAGVAVDAGGNVWVVDSNNHRVLKFNRPTQQFGEEADLVLGQNDFISINEGAGAAGLNYPTGVCVDRAGNAWVSDNSNSRVLIFAAPIQSTGAAACLVLGQPDFTQNGYNQGGLSAVSLAYPQHGCVDAEGNYWIADTDNNRILKFSGLGVSAITPHSAANTGRVTVTNLAGQLFSNGATARLAKAGQPDIPAESLVVASANRITCTFDLTGKTTGRWDVVVSTGGAGTFSAAFADGFEITGTALPSTGTFTGQLDGRPVSIGIPDGAFGQNVAFTVTTTTVPSSDRPTLLMGHLGFDISNNLDLQPQRSLTLELTYLDADIAGLDESRLAIAWYDETHVRWVALPSTVYPNENRITARLSHLSRYAVVQLAPAANLAGAKVYPNPFDPKRGKLVFDNLPAGTTVRIFTVAGEQVRELREGAATGRLEWDGRNAGGTTVASGVYIAFLESPQGTKKLKIAVQK